MSPLCVSSLSLLNIFSITFFQTWWFCVSSCLFVKSLLTFLIFACSYRKALQEENKPNADSVTFRVYVIVIGIYAGFQFFISFLMRIPACHRLTNQCDRWPLIRFVKWMRQVWILLTFLPLEAWICDFPDLFNFFMLIRGFICFCWFLCCGRLSKERHYVGRGMYERTTDFIK